MQALENQTLPPVHFYAFHSFLDQLLSYARISDFTQSRKCRFEAFDQSRTSHKQLNVDPTLVENEIGGVIMGSLEAADLYRPMSRESYLSTKRSNVENKTQSGLGTRSEIYDIYEKYHDWKKRNDRYDINDAVLRLLEWQHQNQNEIFSSGTLSQIITFEMLVDAGGPQPFQCLSTTSGYLDEVQDLSYASIVLICKLAGRRNLKWVCAGDPAQMISPGCSFTFDGLKETLLFVRPFIENSLKEVNHLLVNYRTTKDVLELGNEVLHLVKEHFPGAIRFGMPEIATKDLGYRVLLCNWDVALAADVKLGQNQALIYSCEDRKVETLEESARGWIGAHPFIISSLDSKGLEFDDVIVAFDFDRKVWDPKKEAVISLRMLRELYVAVTRARRRVVILVNGKVPSMYSFFENLGYQFQTTGA
jgi:superfamily I DNA/RNA helicase